MLPNFLGDGEDLGTEGLGVLHLDPLAIAQDDHPERRSHPVLLLDEQEIGRELEPMAPTDPLRDRAHARTKARAARSRAAASTPSPSRRAIADHRSKAASSE